MARKFCQAGLVGLFFPAPAAAATSQSLRPSLADAVPRRGGGPKGEQRSTGTRFPDARWSGRSDKSICPTRIDSVGWSVLASGAVFAVQ